MPVAITDGDFREADRLSAYLSRMIPQTIAEAIATERERCAQVADSYANDAFHGQMIAAAIRRGLND